MRGLATAASPPHFPSALASGRPSLRAGGPPGTCAVLAGRVRPVARSVAAGLWHGGFRSVHVAAASRWPGSPERARRWERIHPGGRLCAGRRAMAFTGFRPNGCAPRACGPQVHMRGARARGVGARASATNTRPCGPINPHGVRAARCHTHFTPPAPPGARGPVRVTGLIFPRRRPTNPRTLIIPPLPGLGTQGARRPGTSALANHPCLRARSSGRPPSGLCASVRTPATPCSLARAFSLSCACTRDGQPGTAARQPRASAALGRRGGPRERLPCAGARAPAPRRFRGVTNATGGVDLPPPRTEGLATSGSGQSFFPFSPRRARLRLRAFWLACLSCGRLSERLRLFRRLMAPMSCGGGSSRTCCQSWRSGPPCTCACGHPDCTASAGLRAGAV